MARSGRSVPNRSVIRRSTGGSSLATVVETDETLPFLAARSKVTEQAIEIDTAFPMARTKVRILAQVAESDTAHPARQAKNTVLQQVSEIGIVRPAVRRKVRLAGQVIETGMAFSFRSKPILAQTVETDTARPFHRVKIRALRQIAETDSARPFEYAEAVTLGQAAETDAARPVARMKVRVLAQVTETDTARAVLRRTPPLRVRLPRRSWSARFTGRGQTMEQMSSLSLEYLGFYVDNAIGSEQVEIAFTVPGVEPLEGQWNPASWGAVNRGGAVARIRVGPGAVVLPDGTYQGWVRVTRPDERPVLASGLVTVT
ncbi:hypothetical protein [Streptosporangium saharense]|uniref:hypothetical protein n=1 Tax=Streptosporangium saharense TaxID=1706840 RepID=UPI0034245729